MDERNARHLHLADADPFADRLLGEVLLEAQIQHETVTLLQHAREGSQFDTSVDPGEPLLVHAEEFTEGLRRSVGAPLRDAGDWIIVGRLTDAVRPTVPAKALGRRRGRVRRLDVRT